MRSTRPGKKTARSCSFLGAQLPNLQELGAILLLAFPFLLGWTAGYLTWVGFAFLDWFKLDWRSFTGTMAALIIAGNIVVHDDFLWKWRFFVYLGVGCLVLIFHRIHFW